MSTTVEVFIDYVCPFCFLVEGTIDELKRECDVNLVIRPFELRPKPIPTLRPRRLRSTRPCAPWLASTASTRPN